MFNQVTLIGRLGKDPVTRHAQSGDKIVSFSLATSETWKKDGERQERVEWSNVVVFNPHIADVAEKYLRKGSLCAIQGQLQTRKWEKDGQTHYTTEVVIPRFRGELRLLDTRSRDDEYDDDDDTDNDAPVTAPAKRAADLDDEIPF